MTIDPVCGMQVDERTAPEKAEYQGKRCYFCKNECKQQFDRDPGKYTAKLKVRTAVGADPRTTNRL